MSQSSVLHCFAHKKENMNVYDIDFECELNDTSAFQFGRSVLR